MAWGPTGIYFTAQQKTNAHLFRTPTLIQHGTSDKRVPVPNAYEFYRRLRDQGVDCRMILYTGFGHGINEPKSMLAVMRSNLDWFSHYIWNEPIPKDSPIFGTSELGRGK